MISVKVDDHIAMARLGGLPEAMRRALRQVIIKDGPELPGRVRAKLSGSVLSVRSGKLLASIRHEMVENATQIYGRVYSMGVPYAGIHEHGGQTRAHIIRAVNAKALRFQMGGETVFAKEVHHPGSKIPARPYLSSSLAEMRDRIVSDL